MDLPSLSHWANVNGFMVDPGCAPPRPLRSLPSLSSLSTLKFTCESKEPSAGRKVVFWAIETILPELGCTETMAAPHLSGLAPADALTCSWAAAWALGSRVVVMVSPPP